VVSGNSKIDGEVNGIVVGTAKSQHGWCYGL
jgi:hypothetical protein